MTALGLKGGVTAHEVSVRDAVYVLHAVGIKECEMATHRQTRRQTQTQTVSTPLEAIPAV